MCTYTYLGMCTSVCLAPSGTPPLSHALLAIGIACAQHTETIPDWGGFESQLCPHQPCDLGQDPLLLCAHFIT